jgi:DNA-binding IclR family transcriptional regulator
MIDAEPGPGNRHGAQTLERGLSLLDAVARQPMRLHDLAEQSGLTRSTTARMVQALLSRGFLISSSGMLRLGPKLMQLGSAARGKIDLISTTAPVLERLSEETGLCSFLGRREGDESLHLLRNPGQQRVIVSTPAGTRRRLAETSLGKTLMLDEDAKTWKKLFEAADIRFTSGIEAEMRRHADAGVVIHHGPPPDMIRAVAAPIRDASGAIIGALSVASVAQYVDDARLEMLVPHVRNAAELASAAMGFDGQKKLT